MTYALLILNSFLLLFIIKKQKKIMTKLEELQERVTSLQNSIDAKQAAIAEAIASLQAQIAAGVGAATEADLQAIIDSLAATQADVDSTPTV